MTALVKAMAASSLPPAVPERPTGFITGTVTACEHVEYEADPLAFDVVDVELDEPVNGARFARALVTVRNGHDPIGRRLRGELYLSDDHMAQMLRPERSVRNNVYAFMKQDGSLFLNDLTLHVAVDDERLQATGDALKACWDMGLHNDSGMDYYIAHGLKVGQDPESPGFPKGHFIDQKPDYTF